MEDYLTGVPYTWGYFSDQSPVRMSYVAALHGMSPPRFQDGFSWLELGCGNGLTAAVLASSHPQGRFWAVDINPTHIWNARRLVERGGLTNLVLFEGSFRDFMNQNAALKLDFITLHGVYSWVGFEVRAEIREVLARMLKPGGLVYVSYNAMPGCAERIPLRRLLLDKAKGTKGSDLKKARAAVDFVLSLADADIPFFQQNTRLRNYARKLKEEPISYIAHEFLNTHWKPFAFSEMAEQMGEIGLQFCGSTCLPNNADSLRVPANLRPYLPEAGQISKRESWTSVLLNEVFRFDIYARQPERGSPEELSSCFVPASLRLKGAIKATARAGCRNLQFSGDLYERLVRSAGQGARSLGELFRQRIFGPYTTDEILKAVFLLTAARQFEILSTPARPLSGHVGAGYRLTSRLNSELLSWRLLKDRQVYLATPVRGCGLYVGLTDGLLLLGGHTESPDVWLKNARDLAADNEMDVDLEERVKTFTDVTLPMLEAYGVVESVGL